MAKLKMPRELADAIGTAIEPHTMNCYLDHGDTMDAIKIAYPIIRDYLRGNQVIG